MCICICIHIDAYIYIYIYIYVYIHTYGNSDSIHHRLLDPLFGAFPVYSKGLGLAALVAEVWEITCEPIRYIQGAKEPLTLTLVFVRKEVGITHFVKSPGCSLFNIRAVAGNVCTCMHACMHTYMNTNRQTDIHTSKDPSRHRAGGIIRAPRTLNLPHRRSGLESAGLILTNMLYQYIITT